MNEYFISHFETETPECDAPALWEKKPPRDFGANLRRLRWNRDLSIRQLARAAGVTPGAIHRYENGVGNIKIVNVYRLCRYFEVSADELLGFTRRHNND